MKTWGGRDCRIWFFLRDFLYSEIAAIQRIPNIPDEPDLAIAAGAQVCTQQLEVLRDKCCGINILSSFRSAAFNDFCNRNSASKAKDYAGHIWDRRDVDGHMGATARVVVPSFADK